MPDDIGRASAAPAAQTGKRFAAFISYSHCDEEFGDWLHKRLESYQVPSALVGRESSVGQIGKRLGKVFRDRADLSAAHDLGREIREGLEQSDALIVLCSPRSCGSKYVQEEIRIFKQLGKGQRIFAAIIDGEPHAAGRPGYTAADECFPPSLIYSLNDDGSLSSHLEPTEPIAADFRDGKDGRENGSLKLIAGLLDVGLDELVQREKQAERRRRWRANALAAAMTVLALGAIVGGAFALINEQRARTNESIARGAQRLAERTAEEREAQRSRADREAREAVRQSDIALANAQEASAQRDQAREALAQALIEKSWDKIDANDHLAAALYALAALRLSPSAADAVQLVLGRIAFEVSTPASGFDAATFDSTASHRLLMVLAESERFADGWFSLDGSVIITRGRQEIAIHDSRTGTILRRHRAESDDSRRVIFATSGDASSVIYARQDELYRMGENGDVRFRSSSQCSTDACPRHPITAIALDDNGELAISSDDRGALVFWDAQTGVQIGSAQATGPVNSAIFDRDGDRFLLTIRGGSVEIWSASTKRRINAVSPLELGQLENDRISIAASFSFDGSQIVTASGGEVQLWNASTGAIELLVGGDASQLAGVSVSPNGRLMAGLTARGEVGVWDIATGRTVLMFRGSESAATHVVFSPDGTSLLTSHQRGGVRLWDIRALGEPATKLVADICVGVLQGDGAFTEWHAHYDPLIESLWGPDSAQYRDNCV